MLTTQSKRHNANMKGQKNPVNHARPRNNKKLGGVHFKRKDANRVSIINQPKYWRFFFTRELNTKNRYVYTQKKGYESIISNARFLAVHKRYPIAVVV